MDLFSYPAILAALALLIVLHVLSAVLCGALAKILAYINIALHVAMLGVLAYFKISIEESVLAYLISIFAYTLIETVLFRIRSRRKPDSVATDEAAEPAAAEEGEVTLGDV